MKQSETIAGVRTILRDVASKEDYRLGLIKAVNLLCCPVTTETLDTAGLTVSREWITALYAGDADSAEKLENCVRTLDSVRADLMY